MSLGALQPCPKCATPTVVEETLASDPAAGTVTVLFRCPKCAGGEYVRVSRQLLEELFTSAPAPTPEALIVGGVIGFRAWRIRNWALAGTGVDRAWVPGVNEATCDPGRSGIVSTRGIMTPGYGTHRAPAVGCDCGLTALARFADRNDHWGDGVVLGAIEAWSDETVAVPVPEPGDVADATGLLTSRSDPSHNGRFILHGTGFRAQYAKVVLLAVDDAWPVAKKAAVRALAAEHEADVCEQSHLEDAAKEHGQLVPDELLEWAKDVRVDSANARLATLAQQLQAQANALSRAQTNWSISHASRQISQISGGSIWTASKPPVFPRRKGISQRLGYPGPPITGRFRRGDRVLDRNRVVWECVKGGKPGRWVRVT